MDDKITTVLWFDRDGKEAAEFYVSLLPDSRIDQVIKSPADHPSMPAGGELVVDFTLAGRNYSALNGGPTFKPNESVSFMVVTEDQAETDRLNTHRRPWRTGKRMRLVQGQMGIQLADHAANPARTAHRSRPFAIQTGFRGHDDHDQDRHRSHPGGSRRHPRLNRSAGERS